MEIFWIVTGAVTGVTFLMGWAVDRRPKIAAAVALMVGGTLGLGGLAVDAVVPDAPAAVSYEETNAAVNAEGEAAIRVVEQAGYDATGDWVRTEERVGVILADNSVMWVEDGKVVEE